MLWKETVLRFHYFIFEDYFYPYVIHTLANNFFWAKIKCFWKTLNGVDVEATRPLGISIVILY